MTATLLEPQEVQSRVPSGKVFGNDWVSREIGQDFDWLPLTFPTTAPERYAEGYGISGVATAEERTLLRVLGTGLLLFIIIGGMALSQYVIHLFAWASNLFPL
jgi:hypothetical protein